MATGRGRIGIIARAAGVIGVTGTLAASFLIATSGTAFAAGSNWFVNPGATGSDSNACTSATAPCKTITHALALATDKDTITLAAGTYVGTLTITKAVTIQGAGAGSSIINANETTPSATSAAAILVNIPAADVNTLTISGVTIENGISKFGGGIELFDGKLTLNNSTVTNNSAGGMASAVGGGGIGAEGVVSGLITQLTLNNDTISNNKGTAVSGGGLYLLGPTVINNTAITGNSTTGNTFGGGVVLTTVAGSTTPASAAITDSTITGNRAVFGGGIANYTGGTLTLTGDGVSPNTVSSNTGTDGAGLYNVGAATISGTTFNSNSASFEGGAFFETPAVAADTPSIVANADTFTNNTGAVAGGAGLLAAASSFTMTGGSMTGGHSIVGAGLYVAAGDTATLTSANISSNSAQDGGGLAIAGGGTANLSAVTVSNNVANSGSSANLGLGGGILDSGALSITGNSTLSGNQAIASTAGGSVATGWGGAVFEGPSAANDVPTFTLTNSTISGGTLASGTNAAVGGGIAVTGNVLGTVAGKTFTATPAVFTGSGDTFSGLSAIDGAGAYVGGTATFTGSTFSNDTASGSSLALGGGLLVGKVAAADAPVATVDSTSISGSGAALGGGIAVNSSSSLILRNGSTLSQDTASNSGGGLYMGGTGSLTNSTIQGNTAALFGGAIFDGSVVATDTPSLTGTNLTINQNSTPFEAGGIAVAAKATLSLSGGTLDGNTAVTAGGGLVVVTGGTATLTGGDLSNNTDNGGDGGAAFNSGALTITNSTIDANSATPSSSAATTTGFGGAIYSGASAASATTSLVLSGDTFSGNTANAASVLITLSTGSGDVNGTSITNSTITGNSTGPSFGTIDAFNPVTIVSSTINANTSPAGASGGLFVEAANAISVAGSDVSGNTFSNCSSAVVDGGYNLTNAGETKCGFTAAKHDLFGNPQLGALGSNGGTTATELPAPSSPLINQIPPGTGTGLTDAVSGSAVTLCAAGAVDQRGITRPQGPACDIGAVEAGVSPPVLTVPPNATYLVGVAGAPLTFSATGTPTPQLTETGALPSGVTFVDNGDGTATLSGTPDAGTAADYTITVKASNNTPPDASKSFTLTVDQAPFIIGPTAATFTVQSPGTVGFTATGRPIPSLTESGALPSGVTFVDNGSGGALLAGTPALGSDGTYPLVITAHNGEGSDYTLAFTLTVLPPVTITTTSLPGGTVGVAYPTTHLVAINGTSPYVWTLASGALPAGLTLAGDGTISGKPTGPAGTVNFVVRVTDSGSPSGTATRALSIVIAKGTTSLAVDPLLLQSLPGGGIVVFGSVEATLTGGNPALPIAGQTIVFSAGSTPICTGVTDATGSARCNITLLSGLSAVLSLGVTATYAGNSSWLGTQAKSFIL